MNCHEQPVFVVFEGLDGAGKTTSAKALAEVLGAAYYSTPSPEVRQMHGAIVRSFRGCQEAAQLFYLATVFAASDEIRENIKAGRSVVLDRYFLSTQAYAEFRGSKLLVDPLGAALLQPDLTVFLDAQREVRRARLDARGHATAADRETLGVDADAELRRLHLERDGLVGVGRLLRLDTSQLQTDAVVGAVLRALV
jgi:dTMP kinase